MSALCGEWVEHRAKKMPVHGDTLVFVRFNDGKESNKPQTAWMGGLCWEPSSWGSYITHYKIHKGVCE